MKYFLHYGESDLGLLCLSMWREKEASFTWVNMCHNKAVLCFCFKSIFHHSVILPCIWSLFHQHTSNPLTSLHLGEHLHCTLLILCKGAYSKTCLKWPLKKNTKIGFHDQLWLNAGQKYCRMLQGEHSAILSTFIKLPFVI